MPQLDPSAWPPQLIWLAITFFALFFVIQRIAIPRIGGVIEARRGAIEGDLAAARRLKADTDAAIAAYEAALAEARSKAFAIEQENRNRLNAEIEAERRKLDAELKERTGEAEARIGAAKAVALSEVRGLAAGIAGEIVHKLIGETPAPAALEGAVAKAAG